MAAFLGEIVFLLASIIAAAGLVVFGRAGAQPTGALFTRAAGVLLFLAGIGSAICTGTLYSKYYDAGEMEHAYPPALMREGGGMSDRMEMLRQRRMQRMQERGPNTDRPNFLERRDRPQPPPQPPPQPQPSQRP